MDRILRPRCCVIDCGIYEKRNSVEIKTYYLLEGILYYYTAVAKHARATENDLGGVDERVDEPINRANFVRFALSVADHHPPAAGNVDGTTG